MSNRPLKNKKKIVVEEETEHEVEYRPPGRSGRDLTIQIGVTFLIVSFILAPMLVFLFSDPPKASQQEQQQQQVQDDTEQQLSFYSKELEKNPNDATVLANLGYYTNQKAGKIQPDPKDPKDPKGSDNMQKTLLATAEGYLRKSLEKDPTYGFAQAELAKNLLAQENFDEAKSFINQALKSADEKIDSSDPKVAADAKGQKAEMLQVSAMMDYKRQDMPAAIAKLGQVIELTPGNPQLYMQRGQLYLSTGDKKAARTDFETLVDIGQKSGDQRATMAGQMMLEQLDKPAVLPTPGAAATPTTGATPAPTTGAATPASTTPAATTVAVPTPATAPTPAAPASPQ